MIDNENFGKLVDFLKEYRLIYNDSDLATQLDVSKGYISSLRKGDKELSKQLVNQISLPLLIRIGCSPEKALCSGILDQNNGMSEETMMSLERAMRFRMQKETR